MAKFYSCALISLCILLPSAYRSYAQSSISPLPKGYYIVVAVYRSGQESYAQRYSSKLNDGGLHTAYGSDKKYCYVYLNQYSDFTESVKQMLKVRTDGAFADAWVYTIREGSATNDTPVTVAKTESQPQKTAPQPVVKVEEKKMEQKAAVQEQKAVVQATEEKKVDTTSVVTEVIDNPPAKPVYLPQTLRNTPVFLSLFNSTDNKIIDGDIEVIDTENGKLIAKVKGNTYVTLPNPGTKSGRITLINNTFGFRKEQLELSYKNTEADTVQPYVSLVGNFYMVNFGLAKIHKGDISTLYNVYFYNDAAVMLPESKYQLNSLLQLMNENAKFKIVLHGHTNGGGGGKITYMGPSKDFFNITKDAVQGSGSAKELSEARANTIREWLMAQKIDESRITVKGWGGSRMIHDKNSLHARRNIRVDVEVVDE